ncbi:MAG: glycosyltransferase family A protein [Pseudomonadota bacterium]
MVSVIIPAYNAEKFISNAIYSVLNQSISISIEIIVIDDGSKDRTREIVLDISRQRPHVYCLENERQKGPSGARNTGLLKAKGEFIAFLDADDIWLQNHLEKGICFLEKHISIDIVFFNFKIVEHETNCFINNWFSERDFLTKISFKDIGEGFFYITDDLFNALLDESFLHLQSMITRKLVLNEILFDEDINCSEDRDFAIMLYKKAKAKFAFSKIVTGIYYRHPGSITANSNENFLQISLCHILIFKKYLKIFSLDRLTAKKLKNMIYNRYMSSCYYYRLLNKYGDAIISLSNSFIYNISFFQLKEFMKILIFFMISLLFKKSSWLQGR